MRIPSSGAGHYGTISFLHAARCVTLPHDELDDAFHAGDTIMDAIGADIKAGHGRVTTMDSLALTLTDPSYVNELNRQRRDVIELAAATMNTPDLCEFHRARAASERLSLLALPPVRHMKFDPFTKKPIR